MTCTGGVGVGSLAVGRRERPRQAPPFVAPDEIRRLGNPFCESLESLLQASDFDGFA